MTRRRVLVVTEDEGSGGWLRAELEFEAEHAAGFARFGPRSHSVTDDSEPACRRTPPEMSIESLANRSTPGVGRGVLQSLLLLAACASPPPADSMTAPYPPEECEACASWNTPHAPFTIFGNTHYVGTHGLASILITSPEGHVLIDGGLPDSAPLILENIQTLGFDIRDVKVILNSHAHYDHAGGIAALQRASGARVVASVASAPVLQRGNAGADDPQRGQLLDFPPVMPVETRTDGDTLVVGPIALTPHLTAGHAPGGTTWTWRACSVPDECLDLVYADSQTPVSTDGFRFTGHSAVSEFERGFGVLDRLGCDILITPHPAASAFWERKDGESGVIDRLACRRYADTARELLARRLAAEAAQ